MKRITLMVAAIMVAMAGYAQTDSTTQKSDTVRIGKYVIIKKQKNPSGSSDEKSTTVVIERRKQKPTNISTNWWILDLGFANVKDETIYGSAAANNYLKTIRPGETPFTKNDLDLRAGKSSNVNVWIFMQRLNVTKGVLNLKYGLGLEMFNYRYENNISYHKNPAYIFRDSVNFSKNKLYTSYLTIPFMVNLTTHPGQKKGLSFSAGVSAGYLVGSHNKQISDERGKIKTRGDFDLEQFRLAYIGELALGPVRLYGSYSMHPLHENGLKQYPYSMGIRFSNW